MTKYAEKYRNFDDPAHCDDGLISFQKAQIEQPQ